MIRPKKTFRRLRVVDLMEDIVVTIPQEMSLRGAACLLNRAEVSSAPVTDADGRCVGILSASTFVSWVASGDDSRGREDDFEDCAWSDWQVIGARATRKDEVRRHMRAARPLARLETPLPKLLRVLAAEGAPCSIVVDAERRPLGIVSADHVLSALVREEEGREFGLASRRPAELMAKGH